MEKEKFYSYLDSSEKKSQVESAFFRSIIDKYPYFSPARVLYLMSLKDNETLLFNEQLYRNAALLPDRRQLFFVLNPVSLVSSATHPSDQGISIDSIREVDSSFLLIEDTQNTNGTLVDISDTTKELEVPISGYELLEINDQDNPNGSAISDKKSLSNDDLIDQFIKSTPRLKPLSL